VHRERLQRDPSRDRRRHHRRPLAYDDGFDMMADAISACRAQGLNVKVGADDRSSS
jgi:hypothetical protein